jgi:hypothetical protein
MLRRLRADLPRWRAPSPHRHLAEAFRERPQWTVLQWSRHPHVRSLTPSGLVDLMLSSSVLGRPDEAGRAQVVDEVYAMIHRHPELRGRDSIDLPYLTECSRTEVR